MYNRVLTLDYKLGDAGWAEVSVRKGFNSKKMIVSYLHDTLADFAEAAIELINGAKEASILLMDEPGEHLIFLISTNSHDLDIEIRWFKDWASWDFVTEKEFKIVFKKNDTILRFAQEVLRNMNKLFDENGLEGYKEKWIENDFPNDQFNGMSYLKNQICQMPPILLWRNRS